MPFFVPPENSRAFLEKQIGLKKKKSPSFDGLSFGGRIYQQPSVAGDFTPAWVMLSTPQESPACWPVGDAVTV